MKTLVSIIVALYIGINSFVWSQTSCMDNTLDQSSGCNLIPNSGFENGVCVSWINQNGLDLNSFFDPNFSPNSSRVTHWEKYQSTPDLFTKSGSSQSSYKIPLKSHTGLPTWLRSGTSGLNVYSSNSIYTGVNNRRFVGGASQVSVNEALRVKLDQPIVSGTNYKLSFWVFNSCNNCGMGITSTDIGVFLTENKPLSNVNVPRFYPENNSVQTSAGISVPTIIPAATQANMSINNNVIKNGWSLIEYNNIQVPAGMSLNWLVLNEKSNMDPNLNTYLYFDDVVLEPMNNHSPTLSGLDNTTLYVADVCDNGGQYCYEIYAHDPDLNLNMPITMTFNGNGHSNLTFDPNWGTTSYGYPIGRVCFDPDYSQTGMGYCFDITVSEGCNGIATNTVIYNYCLTVNGLGDLGPQIYCKNEPAISWAVPYIGPGAYYYNSGAFSVQLPNKYDFDPSSYPVGTHTFSYCTDPGANAICTGCWDFEVTIEDAPNITFPFDYQVPCVGETSIQLYASPAGGTWTGQFVSSSGVFNPAAAGVNTSGWPVTYTVTYANGCSDSKTIYVPVYPQAPGIGLPTEKLGIGDMINLLPGYIFELVDIWPNPAYPMKPETQDIKNWLNQSPPNAWALSKGYLTYFEFDQELDDLYDTHIGTNSNPIFQFGQTYVFRIVSKNQYGCDEEVQKPLWIIENQCSYQSTGSMFPDLIPSQYANHGSGLEKYDFDFDDNYPYTVSPLEPIAKWTLSIAPDPVGTTGNTSASILGLGTGIPIRWGNGPAPQLLPNFPSTRGVVVDFFDASPFSSSTHFGLSNIYNNYLTFDPTYKDYNVCFTESRVLYGYAWQDPDAYSTCEVCTTITITDIAARMEKPKGIGENRAEFVNVYPNPTNGILYISGLNENMRISVLDVNGKIMIDQKTIQDHEGNLELDLHEFSQGVYMLQIIDPNGEQSFQKIIKK